MVNEDNVKDIYYNLVLQKPGIMMAARGYLTGHGENILEKREAHRKEHLYILQ